MKNFLSKFLPDDDEPLTLAIVKILLLSFFILFAVAFYIIAIAVTHGMILPVTVGLMVWYVLRHSKT